MEAISGIASVVQIVNLAGTLIKGIGRFVAVFNDLPRLIPELYEKLDTLQLALKAVHNTFEKRPQKLPFERSHHTIIDRIIQSCHQSLKDLENELPELNDIRSPLKKARLSLEQSVLGDRVKEIVSRIDSYTVILNLSLTTVSLGSLWHTHQSQERIQDEIRKLTNAIRSTPLFAGRGKSKTSSPEQLSSIETDYHIIDHDENNGLEEDIRDWRQTAVDVATVVSLKSLPGSTFDDEFIPPTPLTSVDTFSVYEDTFDPEPDYEHVQSPEVIEFKLEANQDIVKRLTGSGLFLRAANTQRRGIELREQLSQTCDNPCPFDELADMKEKLADILLECDSVESDLEAKTELQRLLEAEIQKPAAERSEDRRCRLYHKLGKIYVKQGNDRQAHMCLDRAFEGRKNMDPPSDMLVEESATMLIKIYQRNQAFDEARGLQEWLSQRALPRNPTRISNPDGDKLMNALRWCKDQGLDVDSPNFRFDVCDSGLETTPLHLAIRHENIEVLRNMLSHVAHVEQRDTSYSTPLHEAATGRHQDIVRLLIKEHNADVNVQDRNGMTPLHRCQSKAGGVKTAELLLEKCPQIVDYLDHLGKTALFKACEMGNEKMVRCLLAAQAKPNIPGPGGCTPLIAAIESHSIPKRPESDAKHVAKRIATKIAIVELLLHSGANPGIQDRHGRTAIVAASNAGLASSEIKDILKKAAAEFRRRTSISSTANTMRSSVSGPSGSSSSIEPARLRQPSGG